MKKTIILVLSILLITKLATAQVYLRAGIGYELPLATQSIGEKQFQQDVYEGANFSTTSTSENVVASYGAGASINVGGGYMFSEHLGVDLSITYLDGKRYKTSDTYTLISNGASGTDETITITNSKAIFIAPSFVVTTGAGAHAPYGRFGVVIGSPKVKGEVSEYHELDGTDSHDTKWEYRGGISFGFQGAVGMNWSLKNNVKFYTEIDFMSLTYYAKERVVTKYTRNGLDNMSQLSESEKKTEFQKKIDNTAPQDYTKPTQALRESKAFSSLSLKVGFLFPLGGGDK